MENISTEVSNWVIWQIEDIKEEVRNGLSALRLAQNGFEKKVRPTPPKENGRFPWNMNVVWLEHVPYKTRDLPKCLAH